MSDLQSEIRIENIRASLNLLYASSRLLNTLLSISGSPSALAAANQIADNILNDAAELYTLVQSYTEAMKETESTLTVPN